MAVDLEAVLGQFARLLSVLPWTYAEGQKSVWI
jgi:hypothetical protein